MRFIRVHLVPCVAGMLVGLPSAAACAVFHDGLESVAAMTTNGGTVNGSVAFVAGVNSNAIEFTGTGFALFSGPPFASAAGSLSMWLQKNSTDTQGGIAQIGSIGQNNSVGVFYANQNDLVFEVRGDTGVAASIIEPGALQSSSWVHLVVTWSTRPGGVEMFTFVDGLFSKFAFLADTLNLTAPQLQLGFTGFYGLGQSRIDEVRFFDWALLDGEVYGEYVFSQKAFVRQGSAAVSTGPVQIVNGQLCVHGTVFHGRGVAYSPTPVGFSVGQFPILSDPGVINRDAPLLRALHANVIRTYSPPPNNTLLDAFYNNGVDPIYMIMDYFVPATGVDFADPAFINFHRDQFVAMVNQFKDHPGVLAWGIGNEVNLGLSPQQLTDWYAMAGVLANAAHQAEGATFHPTMIINGSLMGLGDATVGADDVSLSAVDMWGMNLYFGDHPHCHFDYYRRVSSKPLFITEFGIDAYDDVSSAEYPATQASYDVNQWRWIEQNSLGGTVFEYSDEWWKGGTPAVHDFGGFGSRTQPDGFSNEEWWGLVSAADGGAGPDILTARQVYNDLATEFAYAPGDGDQDGDVDLADYGKLQSCVGGSATGACGSAFEFLIDGVIDGNDLDGFTAVVTGPAG